MATFWIAVDRLGPALALCALLGPFVLLLGGVALAARQARRGRVVAVGATAVRGFGLGLLCAPLLLWLAMCTPPPGEGVLAREGYRRGAVVVAALDRYQRTHGGYPDSLGVLVPSLLSQDVLRRPTGSAQAYAWEYAREPPTGFALTFRYVGPGMNSCTISSAERAWDCSGHF